MAYLFTEGQGPYTVNVGLTNASSKAGIPWPAQLTMDIDVVGPRSYVAETRAADYAAGERKDFSFSFSIPLGDIGNGTITVVVSDPSGVVLDSATMGFMIEEVPIDYGADIVIG